MKLKGKENSLFSKSLENQWMIFLILKIFLWKILDYFPLNLICKK